MTQYEKLLDEAADQNLQVKEYPLQGHGGRICGNRIAIKSNIPTLAEKACILAEELGHFYTTIGDIMDQKNINNRKQEQRARLWAYDRQIGLTGLVYAFQRGCRNKYELADFLDVTVDFLEEAIDCYHSKHGVCVSVNNYVIRFEPNFRIYHYFQ